MFPSLIPSLRRTFTSHHHTLHTLRTTSARLLSSTQLSSPSPSSIPVVRSESKAATPEQIAAAKSLITSSSNPRSRRGNNLDKRIYPSYTGLPTDVRQRREPTEAPDGQVLNASAIRYDTGVAPADMPFL